MFEDLFNKTTPLKTVPVVKSSATSVDTGMFSGIFSGPKKTPAVTPDNPSFLTKVERLVLPKAAEYALGITKKPEAKTTEDYATALSTPVFNQPTQPKVQPTQPEPFGQGSLLKKAGDFISLLPSLLNTVKNALATAFQETPLFSIPIAYAPESEQNLKDLQNKPLAKFNEKISAMTPTLANELTIGFIPDKAKQQAKQIATITTELDKNKGELDNLDKTLLQLRNTNPDQYNKLLPSYNKKVKDYNEKIKTAQDQTAKYLSLPEIQHPNYAMAGSAIGMLTAYSELGKLFAPIVPKISGLLEKLPRFVLDPATKGGALVTRAISQGLGYTVPLFATGATIKEGMQQLTDNKFDPKLLLKEAKRGAEFGATTGLASSFATIPARMVSQAFNFGGWTAVDTLVAKGKISKSDIPGILISAGQGLLFEAISGKQVSDAYENSRMGKVTQELSEFHLTQRNGNLSQVEIKNLSATMGKVDADLFYAKNDLLVARSNKETPEIIAGLEKKYMDAFNLNNELNVKYNYREGTDYIIRDGKVVVLNPDTGRLAPGKQFQNFEDGINYRIYDDKMVPVEFVNSEGIVPQGSGMMKMGSGQINKVFNEAGQPNVEITKTVGEKAQEISAKQETINPDSAYGKYVKKTYSPAEYSARFIEKSLTGQERLRQSPKGAALLKEQLTKEEIIASKVAQDQRISDIVDFVLGKKEMPKITPEAQKQASVESQNSKVITLPQGTPKQQEAKLTYLNSEINKQVEKFRKEADLMASNEGAGVRYYEGNKNQVETKLYSSFKKGRAGADMKKRADALKNYSHELLYENSAKYRDLVNARDQLLEIKSDVATDEIDVEKMFNEVSAEEARTNEAITQLGQIETPTITQEKVGAKADTNQGKPWKQGEPYTPERLKLHEDIIAKLLSGKEINADIVKPEIPGYKPAWATRFHPESRDIADKLVEEKMLSLNGKTNIKVGINVGLPGAGKSTVLDNLNKGYDFYVDYVGNNIERIKRDIKMFKDLGYTVDLNLVAVSNERSIETQGHRKSSGKRYVSKKRVRTYGSLPTTNFFKTNELADNWHLIQNEDFRKKSIEVASKIGKDLTILDSAEYNKLYEQKEKNKSNDNNRQGNRGERTSNFGRNKEGTRQNNERTSRESQRTEVKTSKENQPPTLEEGGFNLQTARAEAINLIKGYVERGDDIESLQSSYLGGSGMMDGVYAHIGGYVNGKKIKPNQIGVEKDDKSFLFPLKEIFDEIKNKPRAQEFVELNGEKIPVIGTVASDTGKITYNETKEDMLQELADNNISGTYFDNMSIQELSLELTNYRKNPDWNKIKYTEVGFEESLAENGYAPEEIKEMSKLADAGEFGTVAPRTIRKTKQQSMIDFISDKGTKFRLQENVAIVKSVNAPFERELTTRFLEHPEVKGKEFAAYSFLMNLSNSTGLGLKQEERNIIQNVLNSQFKDEKKIPMEEFKQAVIAQTLPLQVIPSNSWSDYGSSNVGLDGLAHKTYLLNSPFEHKEIGHFFNDYKKELLEKDMEIREIAPQPGNPTAKFAVVRKGVALNELNVAENVFTLSNTREEAQKWIDEHVASGNKEGRSILVMNQGLFAHIRTFDETPERGNTMISHVAEIQSDPFQKGVLDKTILGQIKGAQEDLDNIKERIKIIETNIFNAKEGLRTNKNEEGRLHFTEQIKTFEDRLTEEQYRENSKLKEILSLQKKDISPMERVFSGYRGIWHERAVREIISLKASEGFKALRFPTVRTVAVIEGFVSGDGENAMPYEILSSENTDPKVDGLVVGDIIQYGGEDMTIVEVNHGEITVAQSTGVRHFDAQEAMDEDIQNRWDEAKYGFNQVEKDFGKIDSEEKAQTAIDKIAIYNQMVDFKNKAKDIANQREWFKNSSTEKEAKEELKTLVNATSQWERFKIAVKEIATTKTNKFDEVLANDFDYDSTDKLAEKTPGVTNMMWRELQGYGKAKKSNIVKAGMEIAEVQINSHKRSEAALKKGQAERRTELNNKILDVKDRKEPTPAELKTLPKDLLSPLKNSDYKYNIDYGAEKILEKMAEAGGINQNLDNFEDDFKSDEYNNYESDYESMYGKGHVFYQDKGYNNQEVWTTESNTEQFLQPDQYEEAQSIDEFDINKFEGNQKTVLAFYERQVNRYLPKIRKGNLELITDDNGYQWYETKLTPEDNNPPTAYRMRENLARMGVVISNKQEAQIISLNQDIFGDTSVEITGQIIGNKKALGSYKSGIIQILNGQANAKDTFYHEVAHKYLDVFSTQDEYISILKEAEKKYNLDNLTDADEQVAEDFIKFAKNHEGFLGKLKLFFERIILRIKKYFGAENKINKLYNDILSGQAKEQVPGMSINITSFRSTEMASEQTNPITDEEIEAFAYIQADKPMPERLKGSVELLKARGLVSANFVPQIEIPKTERIKKSATPRPVVKPMNPGEKISERGIILRKNQQDVLSPYIVSYMTGDKRVVRTFKTVEKARWLYDAMVYARQAGARKQGELPPELQPTDIQKQTIHQIIQTKKITPIQYKRLAKAYTGVDSTLKMTPEQADHFAEMLRLLKPKFGGKISIPLTTDLVLQETAEREFHNTTIGWLIDIFRTPENIFRKIGIAPETKPVFEGFQLKSDFVNHTFAKIAQWQKDLGVRHPTIFTRKKFEVESKRLFVAMNTGDTTELNEKEMMVVAMAKQLAGEVADSVDASRREVGLEPMNRRENYITNLLTDEGHYLIANTKQAPNELYAMLDKRLPSKIFDKLLLERKGGLPIKEDFWKALKAMVQMHGKYIYLNPPVHRLAQFMKFYGDKIPVLSRKYINNRIQRFLGRPSLAENFMKLVDETFTKLLAGVPGMSKKYNLELTNGITEVLNVPRVNLRIVQSFVPTLKSIRYMYDLTWSVSFYAINLTQFWINTIPKLRGTPLDVYRSAVGAYAQMMVDFFRPSRWEYWRQRGVLTEIDNVLDNEYRIKLGGDVLNIFAKLSEFNNRVASALATDKNIALLSKHGKLKELYPELNSAFGEEAQNYARNLANITQFRYGKETTPIAFDNPLMSLYYQYNTFAIKQAELVGGMIKGTDFLNLFNDFKKAYASGKTKEFIADLPQGQRGEFIRFLFNAFILSLILGNGYVWDSIFNSIFKGMVPNQVQGFQDVMTGLWTGDTTLRDQGYAEVLKPPSWTVFEDLSQYGIKSWLLNSKVVKQLNLIHSILTGQPAEIKSKAGKVVEKISPEVAVGRLINSTREKTAKNNSSAWDTYTKIDTSYTSTRKKAIDLMASGKTVQAKNLVKLYNNNAKIWIKQLKDLHPSDLRLKAIIAKISKSHIVDSTNFETWKQTAKKQ